MSSQPDWNSIIRRIDSGNFIPIISDRVTSPDDESFLSEWAKVINFPLPLDEHISRPQVAQFLSATKRDERMAKEDFLDFTKSHLMQEVQQNATADQEPFLKTLKSEMRRISFSEVASRLDYPRFENPMDNPLNILAMLPIKIYITTSYHEHLEAALRQNNKEPQTEICAWNDRISFRLDDSYAPDDPQKPLVFHLHGLDSDPDSLVLTEDDYLDFLVKVSADRKCIRDYVHQALVDSSLLLLGFQLNDWDFKVLFRGLINTKRDSLRLFNLSIQYSDPSDDKDNQNEEVQEYLERYFGKANFDIYWGNPVQFAQELWQEWEAF